MIRSAVCDDVETYLNIPSNLGGDVTIELPSDTSEIACPAQEDIQVNGGVLTLSGVSAIT